MYIDIDPGVIGEEPIIGTFKETGPGTVIRQVRLEFDGQWAWCDVIGWSDTGRQEAWLTPIEESGDGPALLLHGGNQGVRLRKRDGVAGVAASAPVPGPAPACGRTVGTPGDVPDAQGWWSEGFLILRPEIQRA